MLYPQYFIDDLKNRADLIRIIQPYAQDLKRKGANWMACCPFHQEKTPSFTVSSDKQVYHCFGCGQHGNAIGFLMAYAGMGYIDAVKDFEPLALFGTISIVPLSLAALAIAS